MTKLVGFFFSDTLFESTSQSGKVQKRLASFQGKLQLMWNHTGSRQQKAAINSFSFACTDKWTIVTMVDHSSTYQRFWHRPYVCYTISWVSGDTSLTFSKYCRSIRTYPPILDVHNRFHARHWSFSVCVCVIEIYKAQCQLMSWHNHFGKFCFCSLI